MIVDLPYPDKLLWPNGPRSNYHAVNRQKVKHRGWGMAGAWEVFGTVKPESHPVRIPVKIIVSGKKTGPLPDKDNCSAAAKAYLDGIADALGINDRHFEAPVVEFDTARKGRFYIEVSL
jgi:crossover junction endodeoxyribonuclease RusA